MNLKYTSLSYNYKGLNTVNTSNLYYYLSNATCFDQRWSTTGQYNRHVIYLCIYLLFTYHLFLKCKIYLSVIDTEKELYTIPLSLLWPKYDQHQYKHVSLNNKLILTQISTVEGV
jgi:hypothetical protein